MNEMRETYVWVLKNKFDVDVLDTDTDEMVGRAITSAYRATPSDYQIDAHGLGYARRFAGSNNAGMSLVLDRHRQSLVGRVTPGTGEEK